MVIAYGRASKKNPSEERPIIYLVPELLKPTGLTDEMRNNYKCMGDLATVT